jgi:hypothetical protein
MTPSHDSIVPQQKRAYSVNFDIHQSTHMNRQNLQSPSLSVDKNGLRPPSSLISKNSGLPQVFLERYKKNSKNNGNHFATLSKERPGIADHGFGTSPLPHHLESLTLQKRHLSSAECLIPRHTFSESAAPLLRIES